MLLKQAIRKLHILRTIDYLNDYKEESLAKKNIIANSISSLENWIGFKLKKQGFESIYQKCEELDLRDFFAESVKRNMNKAIKTEWYLHFWRNLKETSTKSEKVEKFRTVVNKRRLRMVLGKWKRLGYIHQRAEPMIQFRNEHLLKKNLFAKMKQIAFENPNSIGAMTLRVKARLEFLRKKRTLIKLKLNKERKNFKKRKERKLLTNLFSLMIIKTDQKKFNGFKKLIKFVSQRKGLVKVSNFLNLARISC
jgi:hypothetical protein